MRFDKPEETLRSRRHSGGAGQPGGQRIPAVVVIAIAALFSGCGRQDDSQLVTFVCTETQAVIQAEAQPTPAVNPETGRRTLVRGMYCAQCGKWFPIPADVRDPRAIRCTRDGTPMSLEGPPPVSASSGGGT